MSLRVLFSFVGRDFDGKEVFFEGMLGGREFIPVFSFFFYDFEFDNIALCVGGIQFLLCYFHKIAFGRSKIDKVEIN